MVVFLQRKRTHPGNEFVQLSYNARSDWLRSRTSALAFYERNIKWSLCVTQVKQEQNTSLMSHRICLASFYERIIKWPLSAHWNWCNQSRDFRRFRKYLCKPLTWVTEVFQARSWARANVSLPTSAPSKPRERNLWFPLVVNLLDCNMTFSLKIFLVGVWIEELCGGLFKFSNFDARHHMKTSNMVESWRENHSRRVMFELSCCLFWRTDRRLISQLLFCTDRSKCDFPRSFTVSET